MADPEELTPSGAQPPGDGGPGRQSRQRVKRDHFDVLCDKLTSGTLLGVKAVAGVGAAVGNPSHGPGHRFDSAVVRDLDVRRGLAHIIGGHRQSAFAPQEVSAIADVLKRSTNKPLAAWCVAHLISIAVSQNFTQTTDTQPLYRLKHLQAFPVIAHGCNTLYKRKWACRPDRVMSDDNTIPPQSAACRCGGTTGQPAFKVDIDRAAGDEFNRGLDNNNTLRIALVQLNRTLFDLCIETISDESVNDPHFAGLHPKNEQAQIDSACKRLKQAAAANAGIALLPELAMTERQRRTSQPRWRRRGRSSRRMPTTGSFESLSPAASTTSTAKENNVTRHSSSSRARQIPRFSRDSIRSQAPSITSRRACCSS